MKTRLVLQLLPFLFLLVVPSDGFFFHHPKDALLNFFHSLKGKDAKKGAVNNVHHYHLHYYPTPVQVVSQVAYKAPDKLHLDRIHDETLRSLGWSDYEYKYIPDSKISLPSSMQEPWLSSPGPWNYGENIIESDHLHETVGQQSQHKLILQVPVHQQIVINHRPESSKMETKPNPITAFFQKISRIKEALFSQEKEKCEEKTKDATTLSNKLNAYVVYLPPKTGGQP